MLAIRDLSVHYGPIEALKGVSIDVAQGEIISIIGANGAGKTTLLRTISGLLRPSSGTIRFEGKEIGGTATHAIVRSGLVQVPEGRMVLAKLSVLENLQAAAGVRPDKANVPRDLDRVMDRFPILRERAKQLAGTLSGG